MEPPFYAELLQLLREAVPEVPQGCPPHPSASAQHDWATWASLRAYLTCVFQQRTREEWSATFVGTEACCVPVLDRDEALMGIGGGANTTTAESNSGVLPCVQHAAHVDIVREGQEPIPPTVAPRLVSTPARVPDGSAAARQSEAEGTGAELLLAAGEHTVEILREWLEASDEDIRKLYEQGAIGVADVPAHWDVPLAKL